VAEAAVGVVAAVELVVAEALAVEAGVAMR
jgi:hypothetical protein